MNPEESIRQELEGHAAVFQLTQAALQGDILAAAQLLISTLTAGNKVLLFGNGGSAADAQHIAAELSGRFRRERRALPAIALTTDTSALTAISNDYGYEAVFARQVEALARPGDLLVGISTSGNSPNVLAGLRAGQQAGAQRLGLTGASGGQMKALCDLCLCIPSDNTARIQEMHILIGHILCEAVEGGGDGMEV
jgi:D-sedoheptulose 7-phosphate isomerase